jgi:hypothetical protein
MKHGGLRAAVAAAGIVTLGACSGSSAPHTAGSTTAPTTSEPGSTTVLTTAPVDNGGALRRGITVTTTVRGICASGSEAVQDLGYRCFAGNAIYDPCWALSTETAQRAVACIPEPWSTSAVKVVVPTLETEPPASRSPRDPDYPWAVQLTNGTRCSLLQGTHDQFDGQTVNYGCDGTEHLVLLGIPSHPTELWTFAAARETATGYASAASVSAATVWFGG